MTKLRNAVICGSVPAFCDGVAHALRRLGAEVHSCGVWPQIPAPSVTLTVDDGPTTPPPWGKDRWVICCEVSAKAVRAASRRGAAGVVDIRLHPDEIAQRLVCMLDGAVVLPAAVVDELALCPAPGEVSLTVEEQAWLSDLANGLTVAEVATRSAVSQRELHRRLQRLYRRLRVPGRESAIALAARCAVIEPATAVEGVAWRASLHSG